MSRKGTKVYFITGNHDDFLRRYQPLQLGNIELKEEHSYETFHNKNLLIIHGDQFDIVTTYGRHLALLGDWIYQFLLVLNRYLNSLRSRFGYGYWSLSNYLKQKVKGAVNFMSDYEINVSKECQRRGFDGVVCGHIHKAEIKDINSTIYMNCGDWVESCTALVEDEFGSFKIIPWADNQREKIKYLKAS
jgi:UDP-2,3-diacylglucosamine pyrophosphatase LpxH|tara:strand:+ start:455 stop:1021 length:567 start_codon:yes stop_codon:yes gene_type:complete